MNIPASIQIGSLSVSPATFLAPIAEITDSPFRQMVKQFGGVGAMFTEMIPSDAYTRHIERTQFMVHHTPEEHPLIFQIVGKDPDRMAKAAEMAAAAGADAVDINMGCPSNTLTRHGSGAALLRDPDLARKIVQAVRKAIDIPLTIKIRSGWNDQSLVYREFGEMAESCGVNAVFFHGRTRKQMYRDTVHHGHIADLAGRLQIPVIGNGDIVDRPTLESMLETACDGIMIARGAIKRPWIFAELAGTETGSPEQLVQLAWWQFNQCIQLYPEKLALHKIRLFLGWYSRSLPRGKSLRMELTHIRDSSAGLDLLKRYAAEHGFYLPAAGK